MLRRLGFERREHAALKVSFLLVTHDTHLAGRCDRVIEFIDARIECDGAVDAVPQPEPEHANARKTRTDGA
jgi:ABC-type lipoprotein export system ATPase subunit